MATGQASARKRRRLMETAFHEAGHAAAHMVLARPFRWVTIVPTEGTVGHLRDRKPTRRTIQAIEDGSIAAEHRMRHDIVILWAGPLAERRFRGRWDHRGAAGDYGMIADRILAMGFSGSDKCSRAFGSYLRYWSENLVDREWKVIEALAEALLERSTLTAQGAYQVRTRAYGLPELTLKLPRM